MSVCVYAGVSVCASVCVLFCLESNVNIISYRAILVLIIRDATCMIEGINEIFFSVKNICFRTFTLIRVDTMESMKMICYDR